MHWSEHRKVTERNSRETQVVTPYIETRMIKEYEQFQVQALTMYSDKPSRKWIKIVALESLFH